jgi:hypothetical protein
LSPPATLVVAAIPLLALAVPLKFLELYTIATGQWLLAILVLLFVKLVGVGITAFIFDVTRDKLLQMAWFARMYGWFVWARDWAQAVSGVCSCACAAACSAPDAGLPWPRRDVTLPAYRLLQTKKARAMRAFSWAILFTIRRTE